VIRRALSATVISIALLAVSLGSDCKDTTPECVPRSTAACFCSTGGAGQRVCDDDSLDYGPCTCLPDAGVLDCGNDVYR